jgi:hypothetical protein
LRSDYKADWSRDAVTKQDERLKKKTAKGMAPMDQIEDDDDEDLPPSKEVVASIFQPKNKVS